MSHSELDTPIPIGWVSRTDLLACRPELSDRIATLSEAQMAMIANQIGDALQDTYQTALEIVLLRALGLPHDA
jgi:hypothetical protein